MYLLGARAGVLLGVLRDLTGVERDGGEGAAPVHKARLAGGAKHGVGIVVAAAPPSAPYSRDDFERHYILSVIPLLLVLCSQTFNVCYGICKEDFFKIHNTLGGNSCGAQGYEEDDSLEGRTEYHLRHRFITKTFQFSIR